MELVIRYASLIVIIMEHSGMHTKSGPNNYKLKIKWEYLETKWNKLILMLKFY